MVQINAMKPGVRFAAPRDGTRTSNRPSRSINWWSVIKVILIIVAIAAAVYIGHTYVIPAVVKVIDAAATSVATAATTAVSVGKTATGVATWVAQGMPIAIGGGTATAGAVTNSWLVKPGLRALQIIKYVVDAASELAATKVSAIPFAAAGGGGFAW